MSEVKPKVGEKYLVKADYVTGGGDEFRADMERWKKIPLVVEVAWGKEKVYARGTDIWIIRVEDLIPFKPVKLENK